MPLKRLKIFSTIALIFMAISAFAINRDTIPCVDKVYERNLKTVRIHPASWETGYPVLELYGDQVLSFNFDHIESTPQEYFYTLIHCTYDWKPSPLMYFEYADGFEENRIDDYEDSQSSFIQYSHYEIEFPNRDVNFTKSGNYLLVVYVKGDQSEKIVITRRFMIYEQIASVSGRINPGVIADYRAHYQKLDFTVDRKGLNVYDPTRELKPVVIQNYQWNTAIYDFPFSFIDNEKIVYEWDDKVCFNAANEYRYFNFNNLELNSERVENIEFRNPYYYIDLVKDKFEMFSPYSSVQDINGSYVIRTKRFANNEFPEIQSEYAIVKFRLEYKMPLNNADVYLYGDLTNYSLDNDSKMLYNLETGCYEKLLFLKQGYYNYRYLLVDNDPKKKPDHSYFEGSHKQTQNAYLLFLYLRETGSSYDRLVNFTVF